MFKRVMCALFLALALAVPPARPAQGIQQLASQEQKKECIVYVTRTGHKYHRAGCSYLRQGAIPTTRNKAIKAGYTACKRCGGSDCEPRQ